MEILKLVDAGKEEKGRGKMNNIDNYMTVAEAAYRWGLPQETVKSKLKPSIKSYKEQTDQMLKDGLIKFFQKPGGQRKEWIISIQAMEQWFGEPKKKESE